MNAGEIKALLQARGLTPNRALGQNFLVDEAAAAAIAGASGAAKFPVLEIGPGLGALTEALLRLSSQVVAVEIDAAMISILKERFSSAKNLLLRHEDFLDTDLDALKPLLGTQCAVAANLPYYVTTPICMKLLTSELPIAHMALMLQKEAAERFTTLPGSRQYGPLTVLAQRYYEVKTLMTLPPARYYPQPDVDSVVLTLCHRPDVSVLPALPRILATAFSMRRKTLLNNLRSAGLSKESAEALLEQCAISPAARAEALPPKAFAHLAAQWEKISV